MSKAIKPLALAAGAVIVAVAGWSQAQQGSTQNPATQDPATQNPAPGTTDPGTTTSPDAGAAGTTQQDNAPSMDARADRN
jgi:hypothetical protein